VPLRKIFRVFFTVTLLATVSALVTGCYPSENQIWTPKTLVYLPELIGVYQGDAPAAAKGTTTVEKGDAEKSYRVTTRNATGERTGGGTLHLVKLGDHLFYDYEPKVAKPDEAGSAPKVFHIFGRLAVKDNKVTFYHFGSHLNVDETLRWKTVFADDPRGRVIVNTTEELQAFLKANADKMTVEGVRCTKIHD
jgi:hypothetical protein